VRPEFGRYDQSRDVDESRKLRTKSGYMTRVIFSDRSQAYDWSHAFQSESRLPIRVAPSDWSWVFRPESGIRLESRI
jgi:hypothetical protein